jgi:hypothetical protein
VKSGSSGHRHFVAVHDTHLGKVGDAAPPSVKSFGTGAASESDRVSHATCDALGRRSSIIARFAQP